MRAIIRYAIIALVVVGVSIAAISPFASSLVEQWSRRDIELRSTLVFNSIRDELAVLLAENASPQIDRLFERLALDERLIAVGFCDPRGVLVNRSKLFPKSLACADLAPADSESFSTITDRDRKIIVASFPVDAGEVHGRLVLLHDLSFAERRAAEARSWILIALAGVALVGGAVTSLVALLIIQRWLQSVRGAIEDVRSGRSNSAALAGDPSIAREIRHVLREFDETRRSVDALYVDWNPEMLRLMLANELPDAEVIVVSNREPYIHNRSGEHISLQIPASGLVAAV